MKNIHLIPTDNEQHSIVRKNTGLLLIQTPRKEYSGTKLNLYITSDEQPKHNDYYTIDGKKIYYCNTLNPTRNNHYKKIILTTDQDLIKDGVQSIGDEYLEWYIWGINYYKTIIPKEEPKQETLEEAAKKYAEGKSSVEVFQEAHIIDFNNGAKWQAERMYSEEEVNEIIAEAWNSYEDNEGETFTEARKRIIEQFKKKEL